MSRNGSGVYSTPNTFTAGTTITASDHNENWDDLASEMTNSVAADGQTSMTGALKLSNGTVAAPAWTFASDTDSGAYRIGANNIGIGVNGAKVLDIATTGLSVTGTLTSSGALTVTTGGLTVTAGGLTITAGGLTVTAGGLTVTAGGLTVSASGAAITGNSTITGTLTTSGALTVQSGGASITGTLAVTGVMTSTGTATLNAVVASTGLTVSAGGAGITGNSSVNGTFAVSGVTTLSNQLVINSSGFAVVGTSYVTSGTLSVGKTTGYDMTQAGTTFEGQRMACTGSSEVLHLCRQGNGTAVAFYDAAGSTARGSISHTNDASTAYNTSSDARLKKDIADIEDALGTILELKPRTFNWRVDDSPDFGFIAQEAYIVDPRFVTGTPDGAEYMQIDYSRFVTHLVGAVQQLSKRIDDLEAR